MRWTRLTLALGLAAFAGCHSTYLPSYGDLAKPPLTDGGVEWVSDEVDSDGVLPVDKRRIVARFDLDYGGSVQLVNLADAGDPPDIALITQRPRISRSRSPQSTLMSPLEIYLALAGDDRPAPEALRRHHAALAAAGIFAATPRETGALPWDPGEPEFGANDLCEGSFVSDWLWFSMGHGSRNLYAAAQLWTGWSVLTGSSEARSVAACLADTSQNSNSASARYVIRNRQEGGSWQHLWTSDWLGKGAGVGFQTYGPGKGRTRIVIETKDDEHYIFFVGASWDTYDDWLTR